MADRLEQQVLSEVGQILAQLHTEKIGDSPIEHLLIRALRAASLFSISTAREVLIVGLDGALESLLSRQASYILVVQPQAQLAGWRVDFLIRAWHEGDATRPAGWRELIVECDGHDFHERTREQAARDRSRDRNAQIHGRTVLRFTGSEIHRDPIGCSLQIGRWALGGWR